MTKITIYKNFEMQLYISKRDPYEIEWIYQGTFKKCKLYYFSKNIVFNRVCPFYAISGILGLSTIVVNSAWPITFKAQCLNSPQIKWSF